MLGNLGEIYNYTNDTLLEGNLDGISDVLNYFEEFQNMVAEKAKIEAPVFVTQLTSNVIVVPDDFLSFAKVKVDGKDTVIVEAWGKELTLPKEIISGSASLYYYKKPTPLDPSNLNQVPDIDSRYFHLMGQYAAKMYYVVDDDKDMVDKLKDAFRDSIVVYSTSKGTISRVKNIW